MIKTAKEILHDLKLYAGDEFSVSGEFGEFKVIEAMMLYAAQFNNPAINTPESVEQWYRKWMDDRGKSGMCTVNVLDMLKDYAAQFTTPAKDEQHIPVGAKNREAEICIELLGQVKDGCLNPSGKIDRVISFLKSIPSDEVPLTGYTKEQVASHIKGMVKYITQGFPQNEGERIDHAKSVGYNDAIQDVVAYLSNLPERVGESGWGKEKPVFDKECTFVTATKIKDIYEYKIYQIGRVYDADTFYLGWLNDEGEEYGDIADISADIYLVLPPQQ